MRQQGKIFLQIVGDILGKRDDRLFYQLGISVPDGGQQVDMSDTFRGESGKTKTYLFRFLTELYDCSGK